METSLKQLYIKDGNGSTIKTDTSIYQDEIIRHSAAFKNIQRKLQELKCFSPKQDDIWILTYPKSGTHWVCEIVGILLSGKLEHVKQHKENAMFEMFDNLSVTEKLPSPRVFNSHLQARYFPENILQQNKIICVVRNPKSVAVSYFNHIKNMPSFDYEGTFDGYLPLYNEGIDDTFGSWFEYVLKIWDLLSNRSNVHFVFYEDLLKDTLTEIQKVAKFLKLERDENFCQGVVNLTSLKEMSTLKGKDTSSEWHDILVAKATKTIYRKGIADDWKNYFSDKQNEEFDKQYEEKMKNHQELKLKIKFE